MIPLMYEEVYDWQGLSLRTNDNKLFSGSFTSLRINRKTIPAGLFAYDVRSDEDGNIIELKDFVFINHWGTFVTDNEIPSSSKGIEIINYKYNDI